MQMRQRDVAALDAKYTKDIDAVLEIRSARRCCRWSSSVAHQSSLSSVREATTASGVIMQPPPDWQTPLNGIISPPERLITMQKQLEGTQKYINEQCR